MTDEQRRDVERRDDDARKGGKYSEEGDAGSPLGDEPSRTGVSEGAPGRADEGKAGGPNPVPRREQAGM